MSESFLSVRLTPRSSRDELQGWQDDVLRVKIKAPPVDGRANEELCRYVASLLGVPTRAVGIVSGHTARLKRLRIEGLTAEEVRSRLQA